MWEHGVNAMRELLSNSSSIKRTLSKLLQFRNRRSMVLLLSKVWNGICPCTQHC
jgi:hypothetical protein